MSVGCINKEILINTVKGDMANGTANAIPMIKKSFSELSNPECAELVSLLESAMSFGDADKVSLVVTAPPSFLINARTTMNVVQSLVNGAERNILITGYSMSSYFSDFDMVLRYKGRFLKVYNYHQDEDKMAVLHAKVISVDQKQTLITSANLSYHGQQGNIELGTLIESKQIARQIEDIFTKLTFSKVFREV